MSNTPTLITRKEIAQMLGESEWIVRQNEKRLGLDQCRRDINPRTVRYIRREVITILTRRGLI